MLAALAALALLAANPHGNLVDESKWADVLSRNVKDARVDYPALKADRKELDDYLAEVAAVTKDQFDAAPREAQIAYLVNAYNAYTIASILDNYPKPVKNAGGLFSGPGNSIKQIKNVWSSPKHKTALGDLTLDNIEHDNLRRRYKEPLLHMALVCASKSCPPLRGEPYYADQLQSQLEDQARAYLASPYGLKVKDDGVEISSIFKWYGDDFKEKYGSALGFVEKYAPADEQDKVRAAEKSHNVSYLDYDWTLNEQKKAS